MAVSSAKNRTATENRMKAMSHPLRSAVYGLIAEGPKSPTQISRLVGDEDVPKVSYHCKKLVEYGCAELVGTRPVRGATEHFYRALDRHAVEDGEWMELVENDPTAAIRLVGEFVQPIIDDFTEAARNGEVGKDENFHITRTPVALDAAGIAEGMKIFAEAREAMHGVLERVAARGGETVSYSSSLAFFRVR